MQFEEKKQQEKAIKSTFSAEVEALKQNEELNNQRIEKTQTEKDALLGI